MLGRWFSTTAEHFLAYESLLERDWMMLMDFDHEVDTICKQPLDLPDPGDRHPFCGGGEAWGSRRLGSRAPKLIHKTDDDLD
jgi:hypothetical protein